MKTLALFLIVICSAEARSRWMPFQATAYSAEGQTASGKQTREGRTIAADTAVLPLGTKVQVKGAGAYDGVYVVHDTGRKVDGKHIDIFIDDPAEAKKFGNKPVQVRVVAKAPKATAAAAKK